MDQKKDNEVEIFKILSWVWKKKIALALFSIIIGSCSIYVSLLLPNIYEATTLLTSSEGGSGRDPIPSKYSKFAKIGGIAMGAAQGVDPAVLSMAVLTSKQFVNKFVAKYELQTQIMACKGWDSSSDSLIFNEKKYNVNSNTWNIDDDGDSYKPSSEEIYAHFTNKVMSVSFDEETKMITLSIRHYSPIFAARIANLLIQEINNWEKEEAIKLIKENIEYLKTQLDKTRLAEMQKIFYQLIENQIKELMFAEVGRDFAFKVVDPAFTPEKKSSPRRSVFAILGVIGGFLFGALCLSFPALVREIKKA